MATSLAEQQQLNLREVLDRFRQVTSGPPTDVAHAALVEYVEILCLDPPSRAWHVNTLVDLADNKLPKNEALRDEQLDLLTREGPRSLSFEELVAFCVNPAAVFQLADALADEFPDAWSDAYDSVGRRVREAEGITLPSFDLVSVSESSQGSPRRAKEAAIPTQVALGSQGKRPVGDTESAGPWQWRGDAFEVDCMVVPSEAGDVLRVSVNVDHLLLSSSEDSECGVSWRDSDDNEKASGTSSSWNADCVEIPIPEGVSPDTGDVLVLRFQRRGPQGCQSLVELRLTLGEGVN